MSIWNGTMGIRFFYIPREIAADTAGAEACLRGHGLPDIEAVASPVCGWSGPDGLLDGDLSDGHVSAARQIRLHLVHMEKRVPEAMLAALTDQECANWMRAAGADFVPRTVRAEIKDGMRKRLLKEAVPSLDATGVWIDLANRTVAAETATDAKIDRMSPEFKAAFGVYPIALTPETAAFTLHGVRSDEIAPCAYSPDAAAPVETSLGMEFLTWLFWRYDVTGGEFRVELHGPQYGYMLEGPLTFFAVGQGAHEVVIRKGSPLNSREAAACLRSGKLLSKARFVIVRNEDMWAGAVDSGFAFTALKLPYGEVGTPAERLAYRHGMLNEFLEAWLALYGQFIAQRSSAKWRETAQAMSDWIIAKSGGAS